MKLIDFYSDTFQKDFINSIKETGFAVIKNHDIPHDLIAMVQDDWTRYFNQPTEEKLKDINQNDPNFGYFPFKTEQAVGANTPDLKEHFHFNTNTYVPVNSEYSKLLFDLLSDMGQILLESLSYEYCQDEMMLPFACESSPNTLMRAIHYPALEFEKENISGVRAAAHEDINCITLLVAATSPGLQILHKELGWIDAPFEENCIVVNIGDQLQMLTNGFYKSTSHRVVNPQVNEPRISIPLFVHFWPHFNLKENFTAQQYLQERLNQIQVKQND